MKKLIIGVLMLIMISCQDEAEESPSLSGIISFGFHEISDGSGRQLEDYDDVSAVLVSLENESGEPVYQLEELKIVQVGEGLFSETLKLSVGNYRVVEFIIVNNTNDALYIAPLEGSEKAEFVNDPLPIPIEVTANTLNTAVIEVLEVNDGDEPSDFGLVNFELELVEELDLIVSFFEEGLPVTGTLSASGMVNDAELWNREFEISDTPTLIELFKNVDEVRLTAVGTSEISRIYTLEDLINQPYLEFDFTDGPQDFSIQVQEVALAVQSGLAILRGPSGVYESEFQYDSELAQLQVVFNDIPQDTYNFSFSIQERGDLRNPEVLEYRVYAGVEATGTLNVGIGQPDVTVRGPQGTGEGFDLLPIWDDRYFHTVSDDIVDNVTISFSQDACGVDVRFLTTSSQTPPGYIYTDYFLFNHGGDTEVLGYLECFSNCDAYHHFNEFTNVVVSEQERQLCENEDWDLVDSIVYFTYDADHLLIFYQSWDRNGAVFLPLGAQSIPVSRPN